MFKVANWNATGHWGPTHQWLPAILSSIHLFFPEDISQFSEVTFSGGLRRLTTLLHSLFRNCPCDTINLPPYYSLSTSFRLASEEDEEKKQHLPMGNLRLPENRPQLRQNWPKNSVIKASLSFDFKYNVPGEFSYQERWQKLEQHFYVPILFASWVNGCFQIEWPPWVILIDLTRPSKYNIRFSSDLYHYLFFILFIDQIKCGLHASFYEDKETSLVEGGKWSNKKFWRAVWSS